MAAVEAEEAEAAAPASETKNIQVCQQPKSSTRVQTMAVVPVPVEAEVAALSTAPPPQIKDNKECPHFKLSAPKQRVSMVPVPVYAKKRLFVVVVTDKSAPTMYPACSITVQ